MRVYFISIFFCVAGEKLAVREKLVAFLAENCPRRVYFHNDISRYDLRFDNFLLITRGTNSRCLLATLSRTLRRLRNNRRRDIFRPARALVFLSHVKLYIAQAREKFTKLR